ncbi:uncharacterized protein [Populus alba]|uniref:INO80 complex subunit D-like n=1 Tax=Populus alba TaxID=43335 RepID=A0A4U5PSV6_POPAL|nr:uncharacterized protein LOC118032134 [Populus alba]TKR98734.1 INO80 complex subunit D-like [Populus alba]
MTAASKNHHPSSSKPPKNHHSTPKATTSQTNTTQNSNLTTNPNPAANPSPLSPSLKDQVLSRATHITRQELLKRRSHKLKQLSKCFKDYYWALMEELKVLYREYYWKYGVSPFKEDHQNTLQKVEQQKQGGGFGVLERERMGRGRLILKLLVKIIIMLHYIGVVNPSNGSDFIDEILSISLGFAQQFYRCRTSTAKLSFIHAPKTSFAQLFLETSGHLLNLGIRIPHDWHKLVMSL